MSHPLIELAGAVLMLITLAGTAELGLLTFTALLHFLERHTDREQRVNRSGARKETARVDSRIENRIKRIAVAIPAHNEAATIARCLCSLARCEAPVSATASIIVVADNCTDGTAELALKAGARVIERRDHQRRGKGFALQFAFTKLLEEGFDAVLVVDADSVVDANLLTEVVGLLDRGADGVQVRDLVLNNSGPVLARLRNAAFASFNLLRPLGRARLGLSCGIFGNGFALSRPTLEAVPYDAPSIVEDLDYHLRLVRAGRKIVFANRTTVRAEMPVGRAAVGTQRARWEGGRARMILLNVPTLAIEAVQGSPRLLEPLLELLLLPLAIHVSLLGCTLLVPFGPAQLYAAFSLGLVACHVSAGIIVGGGTISDFGALLAAPAYVAWKLALIPATLRSAKADAEWIRTDRETGTRPGSSEQAG